MSPFENDKSIGVFYLARGSNPLDLTRRFAESYLNCPAGTDHTLTLICKGFQNQRQFDEHCSLFGGLEPSVIEVPDTGYDIGAYRAALRASKYDLFCLMNSHSIIRAPGWLKYLSESEFRRQLTITAWDAYADEASPSLGGVGAI